MPPEDKHPGPRDWVAVVLAVGIALAINLVTAGVLWVAIFDEEARSVGISENGTQIITGAFGGVIGILGSFLGYRAGERRRAQAEDEQAETE